MQWVRLDTSFPRNHKVLAVLGLPGGERAILTYVFGLAYAGEQGTEGFIPRECLPLLRGRPVDAKRLVDAQFWLEEPGGWMVNGWAEFQPSNDEVHRRTERARAAALVRWEKNGKAKS